MSLFVHERPTVTLMDVLVQIVSELISNRVVLGGRPQIFLGLERLIRSRCPSSRLNVQPAKKSCQLPSRSATILD